MPLACVNSQFEPARLLRSVAWIADPDPTVTPSTGRIAAERDDDRLVADRRGDGDAVDGHRVEPDAARAAPRSC